MACGINYKFELGYVAEAILAVATLAAVFAEDKGMSETLQDGVCKASVAHVHVAWHGLELDELLVAADCLSAVIGKLCSFLLF